MGTIITLVDQQLDEQASEEVEYETQNRADTASLSLIGEAKHHANLSTKAAVHGRTPKRDINHNASTF